MKKIEPYFHLSEKLGKFLSRLEDEMVEELNVYYAGDLTELEVGPITRNAVKGLLRPILGTRVNNINAAYLATKKGISVHESRTTNARGFTNLLTVEIKRSEEHTSELQSRGHLVCRLLLQKKN